MPLRAQHGIMVYQWQEFRSDAKVENTGTAIALLIMCRSYDADKKKPAEAGERADAQEMS